MRAALEDFARTLVESRLVVGAAAAALTVATTRILEVPLSVPLLGAVMAATTAIYALDRILDRRSEPGPVPPTIVASASGAGLALAALLPQLRMPTVGALCAGLPLCTLYAVPLWRVRIEGSPPRRLRPKDHPLGKALYVATAVTGATVLLPLVEAGHAAPAAATVLAAGWVFAVLFGNAVACDLRDEAQDRRAGLTTLATRAGAQRTRAWLVGGAWSLAVVSALAVASGRLPALCVAVVALSAVAVARLRAEHPRWLWGLAIDGALLPLLLLVVL